MGFNSDQDLMPSSRQRRGGLAEDQAVLFLRQKGFSILGRHVTSRYGEIDILAKDGETIVAVEVKARWNEHYGRAIESVTDRKLNKIMAALEEAMSKLRLTDQAMRIDVITVELDGIKHVPGVTLRGR